MKADSFPARHRIRISTVKRLAMKFSLLLAAIVASFSVGIVLLLRANIRQRQNRELVSAALTIASAVENRREYDTELPYYITFAVYKSGTQEIIATNDPFLPVLPVTAKRAERYTAKNYFIDGDLNILYYAVAFGRGNEYVVQTALNMDSDTAESIVSDVAYILALLSLPLLVITYFAAFFIAKRTMKNVRSMTEAAKSISTSKLGERLPVTEKGDDFDELAKTFNDLLSRLQADFERERRFTADVSHELKTPLAVMLGHANLLRRWGKDNPEQLEKSLSALIREVHSMESIVANLLRLSQLENARAEFHASAVDVHALFERLIGDTKAYAPEADFSVQAGVKTVYADEELLYQACTIVISNSIKFAGKKVHIRLSAEQSVLSGFCDIAIVDDGPGIESEKLPHIFERFYRSDESHTRSAGGAGLGLSIVKSIMGALGGSARAESTAGEGTLIVLRVPQTSAVS